jgi:hypothetical protein
MTSVVVTRGDGSRRTAKSVLDTCCGRGEPLIGLVPEISRSVGVDVRILEDSSGARPYSVSGARRQVLRRKALRASLSFDCVVALGRSNSSAGGRPRMARSRGGTASRRVIVLTPNGFLHQPPAPDNPRQEHPAAGPPRTRRDWAIRSSASTGLTSSRLPTGRPGGTSKSP